jgi:hypothetical protein
MQFPRLEQLDIMTTEENGMTVVPWSELKEALEMTGMQDRFDELFGVRMSGTMGPFAHDVDAVLDECFIEAALELTGE